MTTEVRRSALITDGMQSGWTTLRDPVLSSSTSAPTLLEWPCQEEPGSGLTASAPVSDVSTPACTNGYCLLCSAAQKNKTVNHVAPNVQSIDIPMDSTA